MEANDSEYDELLAVVLYHSLIISGDSEHASWGGRESFSPLSRRGRPDTESRRCLVSASVRASLTSWVSIESVVLGLEYPSRRETLATSSPARISQEP